MDRRPGIFVVSSISFRVQLRSGFCRDRDPALVYLGRTEVHVCSERSSVHYKEDIDPLPMLWRRLVSLSDT